MTRWPRSCTNAAGVPHVKLLRQGIVKITVNQDGDPGPDEVDHHPVGLASLSTTRPTTPRQAASSFGAPVSSLDPA